MEKSRTIGEQDKWVAANVEKKSNAVVIVVRRSITSRNVWPRRLTSEKSVIATKIRQLTPGAEQLIDALELVER